MALENDLLRLVPISIFHRALQIGAMVAVQIREYPILVLETSISSLLRLAFLHSGVGSGLEGGRGDGRRCRS